MKNPNPPVRRAIPRCMSLDADAVQLLITMCGNTKAYGLLVSELIRKEARERTERPKMLAELQALAGGD